MTVETTITPIFTIEGGGLDIGHAHAGRPLSMSKVRKHRVILAALAWLSVYFAFASPHALGESTGWADMVLLNGKIVTVEDDRPVVDAVAVRGGVILAVGSDEEIRPFIGESTEVVDLGGKFAMPGFIEGHGHFMMLGRSGMTLDLSQARSWDEIVAMVGDAVRKRKPGEWISGSGWHQEKWKVAPSPSTEGYPSHHLLSRISPYNPVILVHASGHAAMGNAKAMEMAGVTKETPAPRGGGIIRDSEGNPIGVFLDEAQGLLTDARERSLSGRSPEQAKAEDLEAIGLATRECLSKGVTSFQDAGSSFDTIDLLRELADQNKLGIRLWVMIRESNERLRKHHARYTIHDAGNGMLTVRAVKRFMDGALGSRSAWLLNPYSDLPFSTGLSVEPVEEILETARIAMQAGLQLCVHAIGDRANREALNLYETVFRKSPRAKSLRWRIEHAQHLDAADIPHFAKLGVIASMQPIHCTSDAPWVVKRLGEKRAREGAYVWRNLIRSGALVTLGTDAPVEDVDPLANFYAAVTRRLPDGSSFYPEQRMSREEALHAYTIGNAYAAFQETTKGSLKAGKLADIVVLSKDILTVPEEEIPQTQVLLTVLGGKIVYRNHRAGLHSQGTERQKLE
jgi:hypothetical protein